MLLALCFQASRSSPVQTEKLPTFQQYHVARVYRGKPALPVFTTQEEREFRTQIRRQVAKGPNFAGHYTVVTWGCGTQCTSFAVVDATTGQIFFHAQHETVSDVFYNLDSRLLVTDYCIGAEKTCTRKFWEWIGKETKLITKSTVDATGGPPEGFVMPHHSKLTGSSSEERSFEMKKGKHPDEQIIGAPKHACRIGRSAVNRRSAPAGT